MLRNVPLIVILGSTGTGKTKLSIELARRFGAEIISADSMQVYRGLDIVTAKATKTEQSMAKHHLLDVVDAGNNFTVVDFRDIALPIINNLLGANKIPIIVGGTNYYIESALWKVLVNPLNDNRKRKTEDEDDAKAVEGSDQWHTTDQFEGRTSAELHKLLQSVDPDSAQRLHPNDIRKIKRALEVFENHGKTMTAIINEQKTTAGGNDYGGPLRYEHTILFWLQCDQEILNKRLDSRIDDMLSQGLVTEIRNFYNLAKQNSNQVDSTKGALQSIGLKEFLPYLEKYDEKEDERLIEFFTSDKTSEQSPPESFILLKSCLETLRLVTKRYSRNQPKWIRNRFLRSVNRQVPPMYALSTSNPDNWNEDVYLKAEKVIQSYIDDTESDLKPCEQLDNPRKDLDPNVTNFCETCKKPFVGEFQWNLHIKSKRHKFQVARLKKQKYLNQSTVVEPVSET